MSRIEFEPTDAQKQVIHHEGPAFVSACPGAGKTRVLVARARMLLKDRTTGKGIALLSFTNAAVSQLERRLRQERLLPTPAFPHFVGTFDSFLWQFLVAPFGVPGCVNPLRLIPDKDERTVRPTEKLRSLPLGCFDRTTGQIMPDVARRYRFDPAKDPRLTKAYMTSAASMRKRFLDRGELDFDDARSLAACRLEDAERSARLAAALAGRFREVIVDEAQDCNPADLTIIQWLRDASIAVKVVCDPHQSIYGFRGGVAEELLAFGQSFDKNDQLALSDNFRSSEPICNAIVALRPTDARSRRDRAVGRHCAVTTPVHILAYPGNGVPATVGARFRDLVESAGFDLAVCPVLAATRNSGAKAIGQHGETGTQNLTLRLASGVTDFHFAFETGNRKEALERVHRVVLAVEGWMGTRTYRQYLAAEGIEPGTWRPMVLELVRELRYDPARDATPEAWLDRAKALLEPHLPDNGRSINQVLRRGPGLAGVLRVAPASNPPAKTIHSVKGMEFPAVCVVMTVSTASGILDYLENGTSAVHAEEARKIYVAASRAERLLAIATPGSQAARLERHLGATGTTTTLINL